MSAHAFMITIDAPALPQADDALGDSTIMHFLQRFAGTSDPALWVGVWKRQCWTRFAGAYWRRPIVDFSRLGELAKGWLGVDGVFQ